MRKFGRVQGPETPSVPRQKISQRVRLIVAILSGLTACANVPEQSATPVLDKQEIVAKLAQSRWDALRRLDLEAAYKLLSPASRDLVTLEEFRRKSGRVAWKAAKVRKVECTAEDLCTVQVDARYSIFISRRGREVENDHAVTETWRSVAGNWWYVPPDGL